MNLSVKFHDGIRPSLIAMDAVLAAPGSTIDEIGQMMVTWLREAHDAQVGLADGVRFAPLAPRYAKAKLRAGGSPARVVFGPSPGSGGAGGALFASWGIQAKTRWSVTVGATGGVLNRIKASAHDGGLAQYLARPELNRLRIGWSDDNMKKAAGHLMDRVVSAGNQAPGK